VSSFTLVTKNTNRLAWIAGLLVFLLCVAFVCNTLFISPGPNVDFSIFLAHDIYRVIGLLFLISIIALANLAVESYKWMYMSAVIEPISFKQAVKSVLSGLAVGFITPNRLGDFPGRAIGFKPENRGSIVLMNLLSGYSQFIVICLLAIFSLVLLPLDFNVFFSEYESMRFIYLITFALLVIYHVWFLFSPVFFLRLFFSIKFLKRFQSWFENFQPLSFSQNFTALHLSAFRFVLYTVQLMLIFCFFEANINLFSLFLYTNIYFFILTIAPSFMLNKLGIRESISVMVFSGLIDNPVVIVVSVLLLWIINQAIPACFGAWMLLKRKST